MPITKCVTHYSNAPITEAIIDIQVRNPEGLTTDTLNNLREQVADKYPQRNIIQMTSLTAQIANDKDITSQATNTSLGWSFVADDKRQVFQARLNGFTFSRLFPYENWPTFLAEARRLWDLYRLMANPQEMTRIAVRYINRLDLPLPFTDFKEYLRATPEIPSELPQGLANYFFQVTIPIVELSAMLVISQGLVPPAKPDHASVVLDLDLFRDKDLPAGDDDIWQLLDQFRMKKDEVFEACITQKTREIIK